MTSPASNSCPSKPLVLNSQQTSLTNKGCDDKVQQEADECTEVIWRTQTPPAVRTNDSLDDSKEIITMHYICTAASQSHLEPVVQNMTKHALFATEGSEKTKTLSPNQLS